MILIPQTPPEGKELVNLLVQIAEALNALEQRLAVLEAQVEAL
jgi:hypothetical protein